MLQNAQIVFPTIVFICGQVMPIFIKVVDFPQPIYDLEVRNIVQLDKLLLRDQYWSLVIIGLDHATHTPQNLIGTNFTCL